MPLGFTFRLELADGTSADPPTVTTQVSSWRVGETIPLGRDRTFRVIGTRLDEGSEGDPVSVLVVEPA